MTTKVSFRLAAESVAGATTGVIVGEFNNWNPEEGIYLERQEDGSMAAELVLTAGKTYEYRYLLNDGRWVNDNNAKRSAEHFGYDIENCVIEVPETLKKAAVREKTKAVKVAKPEIAPDDLTKIEGVKREVDTLLKKEGITTYKDLGKVTIKKLQQILDGAGAKFGIYDPATWPKQARLAATGKWTDLESWQETLRKNK